MKWFNFKRFVFFFIAYFAAVMIIQTFFFKSEDPMQAIIVKNLFSGIIASVIFTYLMRNK